MNEQNILYQAYAKNPVGYLGKLVILKTDLLKGKSERSYKSADHMERMTFKKTAGAGTPAKTTYKTERKATT